MITTHLATSFRTCMVYIALAVACMIVMNLVGIPLRTEQTPLGILNFEFPWTEQHALYMLQAWPLKVQLVASFQIGLDFLFIALYVLAIAHANYFVAAQCASIANYRQEKKWVFWILAFAGRMLAVSQVAAGALDSMENVGMMYILYTQTAPGALPVFVSCCAAIKFVLVALGMLYGIAGLLMHMIWYYCCNKRKTTSNDNNNYSVQQEDEQQ